MRYLNRILVASNAAVLALLLAFAFAAPVGAQTHITGPSSIWGKCCKTYVNGGRFCCTDCCYTVQGCISDSDPACKKRTEAEI